MSEKKSEIIVPVDFVINQIYVIRGQKVMIDRDLAALYGVETRVLKQSVKRNIERFPSDFMFELSKVEFDNWRSQNVISNYSDKMGLRYAPFAFTEQGVAMLSSILNSKQAIAVNIQIIRIFTKIKQIFADTSELKLEIEQIKQIMGITARILNLYSSIWMNCLRKKKKPNQEKKLVINLKMSNN